MVQGGILFAQFLETYFVVKVFFFFFDPTVQNPKSRRTDPRHPEAPEQRQISRSKVSRIPRGLLYFQQQQKNPLRTVKHPQRFYFFGGYFQGVTPLPKDRYRIVGVRKQGFRKPHLPQQIQIYKILSNVASHILEGGLLYYKKKIKVSHTKCAF